MKQVPQIWLLRNTLSTDQAGELICLRGSKNNSIWIPLTAVALA